jgi:hypothetical protein
MTPKEQALSTTGCLAGMNGPQILDVDLTAPIMAETALSEGWSRPGEDKGRAKTKAGGRQSMGRP